MRRLPLARARVVGGTGASRVDCNHHPRTAREWSAGLGYGKLLAAAAAAAASSWLSGAAAAAASVGRSKAVAEWLGALSHDCG